MNSNTWVITLGGFVLGLLLSMLIFTSYGFNVVKDVSISQGVITDSDNNLYLVVKKSEWDDLIKKLQDHGNFMDSILRTQNYLYEREKNDGDGRIQEDRF
jgi:hypothetical protein